MVEKLNIIVLISGNGSNLQAIIDAIATGLPANIIGVISNKSDAYGVERANKHNIPVWIVAAKPGQTRLDYDKTLLSVIEPLNPDLIVLAGFMRILTPHFVNHFQGKLINIHPSLLPKYPGLSTHEQVIANKDEEHGCTVHFVTAEVDAGPIIECAKLKVSAEDTAQTLKNRVHALEHVLYPKVIRWFFEQKK